jgi:hypothetical protein
MRAFRRFAKLCIGPTESSPAIGLDTIDDIEPAIRDLKVRRHDVDLISGDPLPGSHTSRRWRIGIKRRDRTVVIEPDPWPS